MADGSRPVTASSETGTVQHAPITATAPSERRCTLWVHGDSDYKDEVLVNLELFPFVKPGDLMAISALKTDSGVRSCQEKLPAQKTESHISASTKQQRSDSNSGSVAETEAAEAKQDADHGKRYLFIAKEMPKEIRAKQSSLELSIAKHIADAFCLKHRSTVLVTTVDAGLNSASHVELCFKDEYLARSDMWRMALSELSNKTVFKGQKILFLGTMKAQVTSVYVNGRKVQSAFFSSNTRPVFRSESARFVLFIQMSREMWDFDSEGSGEIMFNKVVNGFLPALFKKWAALKAKHLVSIVIFTRVEYDTGITSELATSGHDSYYTGVQTDGNKKPYKDFFRVVVSEMASGSWTTILYQLKREFKFFRRDISLHRIDSISTDLNAPCDNNTGGVLGTRIEAEPSFAMHGNVLEAINLASSQFSRDYIDRDLMRTGISIVVITPSPGLFEVDYEMLRMTTETLTSNGIGIDLVCLPKMPLHSVPLFRYRNPQYTAFQEELHFKSLRSEDSTPRQNSNLFGSSFSSNNDSLSPSKLFYADRGQRTGPTTSGNTPSEWCYAIPHWIDVSFWTGASQDGLLLSPSLKVLPEYCRPHRIRRCEGFFEVRCKMYEMEMASIMETILSEISVASLQQDSMFSQMKTGLRDEQDNKSESVIPDFIQQKKPYSSLLEFVSGPSKTLTDRHSSPHEKTFFKALDSYDLTKSELAEQLPGSRSHKDAKRATKASSEDTTKRLLAEDIKIFGTSVGSQNGALKSGFDAATTNDEKMMNSRDQDRANDRAIKTRKNSVGSSMTVPSKTSPVRPAKLGRQISLGKYGFGIAAPKAATAELQIEHVSAAKSTSATSKRSESNSNSNVTTVNHLLNVPQTQDRPSSSQSEKSKMKSDASVSGFAPGEEKPLPSQPMTIKSALQSLDSTNQFKSRSVLGSLYEELDSSRDADFSSSLQSARLDDTQKLFNSKLLAGAVPELPTTLSPTTALSPWLSVVNPSNPSANDTIGPSQYRRWQHVFPRPTITRTMKWKSLCAPASVPLTTEYFPTRYQLDAEYEQKPYNISQNMENELSENPKTRAELLLELVGLRLSQGFQVVVGPAVGEAFGQKSLKIANVFDHDGFVEDGASVFMSIGSIIHQLSCVNETEIEVNTFLRKPTASNASTPGSSLPTVYKPAIRTTLAENYETRQIDVGKLREEYNWNYVDTYLAGFVDDLSENLRFWRARFVLIPVERPSQSQRRQGEDNEEEIRLEGIKKLTQLWQRHRILTPSEKRFQSLAARKTKDPNPLDIVYKTDDPSIVVTAELETLPLVEGDPVTRRGQLLENERFRKTKLDIAALAEAIQAPVEKGGVRVQNRRWHFRLHYNCFIGSDMTTWLLENFEDINTREEAVELGNMLMIMDDKWKEKEMSKDNEKEKSKDMGIFVHVEKRHPFRDGQYFYQVTGDYAKQRPETRSGWFASRRRDNSVPSTPMTENAPRPERSRSSSNHDEKSSDSGATTPTTTSNGKRPKVALSKVMKYDVDHRKRSYRAERINLHYDRLHNPDNCYHIRIDWMSVTAKLIEDAIESWATTAERHGLKLVEAPIGEACSITSVHPFRSPYMINLALQPPEQQPQTYFDANSFAPQVQSCPASRHFYHKAIMKRFNFVLDVEAAKNFPSNVDVTYSWGKPDFKYTQYIHRSGVLLAQITDEGNFLLLANRLFNNRTTAAREMDRYFKLDHGSERNPRKTATNHYTQGITSDRPSPTNSPLLRPLLTASSPMLRATSDVLAPSPLSSKPSNVTTPETIKNDLEAFCHDAALLELFYKDVLEKATPPSATPPNLKSPYNWIPGSVSALGSEASIPALGLPPGVFALGARDSSPSPMRVAAATAGAPLQMPIMPFGGRRASVQVGASGEGAGRLERDSPKGSIGEGEK